MALDIVIYSLIVGIFVGISAGYVGSIMVMERMALVGDALSHVALPGLAIGILLGFNPYLGAFAFLFGAAVIIWKLKKVTRLPFETLVGTIFTLALAIGILLISDLDALEAALFGDITKVTIWDVPTAIAIAGVIFALARVIYNKVTLSIISEELAISQGINVSQINLLYLLLVSLVVAIGIRVTGTLLVGMLVVTPAAAAKIISSNLKRYFTLSAIFGGISAFAGIFLTASLNTLLNINILPGPFVVVIGVVIFMVTIGIRRLKKF